MNPACACSEVIIDFSELFERDQARSIGHIRVALRDLQLIERKSPQENRAIVERLWAAFRQRHLHAAERLGTRKQRMSELGRARLDAGAPMKALKVGTARIGRNDPCPCGSGQKYKRCCAT